MGSEWRNQYGYFITLNANNHVSYRYKPDLTNHEVNPWNYFFLNSHIGIYKIKQSSFIIAMNHMKPALSTIQFVPLDYIVLYHLIGFALLQSETTNVSGWREAFNRTGQYANLYI